MIILGILFELIGFFLAFWLPKHLLPSADEMRCGTIHKIETQNNETILSVLLLGEDKETFEQCQVKEVKKRKPRSIGEDLMLQITETGVTIYYPDKKWRYIGYLCIAAGGLMCILAQEVFVNITVRLYKLHDFDLIYLYKNLRFPIKEAMKKALIAYVRDEPVFFQVPIAKIKTDELSNIKHAQFHIKLSEEEDADVIQYLSTLKRFYRNSFLKNLLRSYLAGPVAYVYEETLTDETNKRMINIENHMLNLETLKPMKKRKKKDYMILTKDQEDLLRQAGALDSVEVRRSD